MDEPKPQTEEKIEDIINDLWATMGQQPPEALSDDEDPFPYYESLSRDDEENALKVLEQSTTPSSDDITPTVPLSSEIEASAPVSETVKSTSETDKSLTNTETPAQVPLRQATDEPTPQKSEEKSNSGGTSKQTESSTVGPELPAGPTASLVEASITKEPALKRDSSVSEDSAESNLFASATAGSAEKSKLTRTAVPPDPLRPAVIPPDSPIPAVLAPDPPRPAVIPPGPPIPAVLAPDPPIPAVLVPDPPRPAVIPPDPPIPAVLAPDPPRPAVIPPDPLRPAAIPVIAHDLIEGAWHDASTSNASALRGQVQTRRGSRPRMPIPRVLQSPSRPNGPRNREGWQPNEQFAARPGSRYGYSVYPPIQYNSNVVHYPPGMNYRNPRDENRGSSNRRRERSRNRVRYGPYY